MSKSASKQGSFKRFVEVGRVVLINKGEDTGKLAVVVEIIDHNKVRPIIPFASQRVSRAHLDALLFSFSQAIIDGPSTGVPRQAIRYRYLSLTPHVVPKLPRAGNTATVKKYYEKSGVAEKWTQSSWAKKREAAKLRSEMSDCECPAEESVVSSDIMAYRDPLQSIDSTLLYYESKEGALSTVRSRRSKLELPPVSGRETTLYKSPYISNGIASKICCCLFLPCSPEWV